MKCLVLAPEYPPTKGGIANAAATFAKQMAQRGWMIEVCTQAWQDLPDEQPEEEGRIHRLRINGDASVWNPPAGDLESFRHIVQSFRPDVAVIHGWQEWCVMMLPYLRTVGVPVILQGHSFTFHRMVWNPRPPFGLKKWAGYQPFVWRMPGLLCQLHALVVLGRNPDFRLSFDHWMGVRSGCRTLTIPNGVQRVSRPDVDIREYCPQASGKRIILNVANFCDRKNQSLAVEVAKQLNDESTFIILIGGEDNEYFRQIQSKIQRHHLSDRIAAYAGLPRAITESFIHACDLAMLTSKIEMQPLFLLEAMSIGKPWICPNVGSVAELNGGCLIPMDPGAIAAIIHNILNDRNLYATLSANALAQWQVEFNPEVVYSKWDSLLHKVAAEHQHPSDIQAF
jgi:glycosyltransferase involved in cell wall biosynthesis